MIFPPAAIPIAILLNGLPLQSYNPAYLIDGRVRAPVVPYVTGVADRVGYVGPVMIVRRGRAEVRIRTGVSDPKSLQGLYVPLAPILRALGARVTFDATRRLLEIQIRGARAVETMTPYRAGNPAVRPTVIFTPEPVPTPRPVYTGSPHPRRTPIVRESPRPQRSRP